MRCFATSDRFWAIMQRYKTAITRQWNIFHCSVKGLEHSIAHFEKSTRHQSVCNRSNTFWTLVHSCGHGVRTWSALIIALGAFLHAGVLFHRLMCRALCGGERLGCRPFLRPVILYNPLVHTDYFWRSWSSRTGTSHSVVWNSRTGHGVQLSYDKRALS